MLNIAPLKSYYDDLNILEVFAQAHDKVRIVKLLTQHVVKDDSGVPINGGPPGWWLDYQSVIYIYD